MSNNKKIKIKEKNLECWKQIKNLSSGTIATLTGIKNYDKQDTFMEILYNKFQALPEDFFDNCNNWQQVWEKQKEINYVYIQKYNDSIEYVESNDKVIIDIKSYDDTLDSKDEDTIIDGDGMYYFDSYKLNLNENFVSIKKFIK